MLKADRRHVMKYLPREKRLNADSRGMPKRALDAAPEKMTYV
jgi:hypothetical protein